MIRVEARNGEPLEKTLRRFKKRCEKEGLTKDIKKNLYYDKPSERRRREARKLEKRIIQERAESAAGSTPAR
ncbi:MAG: 30S ribosomal protein S21 [Planctomycetes bacterium]|nr:30S ribosomal protein S21 [Planctomycetota bacterium]